MPLSFTKMHGLGNDYLYVRAQALPDDPAGLSRRLSDRHRGVGSDGMIWLLPSAVADCRMRIFNADGSEAAMCGNGIRCVGKYLYDKGIVPRTTLTVETNAGIKTLQLCVADGQVRTVTVAMGRAAVGQPITVAAAGRQLTLRPVDMGNPHAVCFVPAAENAPVAEAGAALQHTAAFPDGVNAEFVQQIDPHTLRMRVYERLCRRGRGPLPGRHAALRPAGRRRSDGDRRRRQRGHHDRPRRDHLRGHGGAVNPARRNRLHRHSVRP